MKQIFKPLIFVLGIAVLLCGCMGGKNMKGNQLPGGWLEFEGNEITHLRQTRIPNTFFLNWDKDFAWAKYDTQNQSLDINHKGFIELDGAKNEFWGTPWHMATNDFKRFLLYQGRGIAYFNRAKQDKPLFSLVDIAYDEGAEWLMTDSGFTKALVPLSRSTDMFGDNRLGGTPLVLFKVDLEAATYTSTPMDHFADTYLGPDFIMWRHYTARKETNPAKTSHYTATNIDLVEIDKPLVRLLNRYRDTLPDFLGRFHISSQGWALMGVNSPKTKTELFILDPNGEGRIIPLFENGNIAIPVESVGQVGISGDGNMFAIITHLDPHAFPSGKNDVVHVGRVVTKNGKLEVRLKRVADMEGLDVSASPLWIPGTQALVIITDCIDHPSRILILDLDKHPIDWEHVPLAFEIPVVEKEN